jgi:DNA-binding Xre family transcriptional regulator
MHLVTATRKESNTANILRSGTVAAINLRTLELVCGRSGGIQSYRKEP